MTYTVNIFIFTFQAFIARRANAFFSCVNNWRQYSIIVWCLIITHVSVWYNVLFVWWTTLSQIFMLHQPLSFFKRTSVYFSTLSTFKRSNKKTNSSVIWGLHEYIFLYCSYDFFTALPLLFIYCTNTVTGVTHNIWLMIFLKCHFEVPIQCLLFSYKNLF